MHCYKHCFVYRNALKKSFVHRNAIAKHCFVYGNTINRNACKTLFLYSNAM